MMAWLDDGHAQLLQGPRLCDLQLFRNKLFSMFEYVRIAEDTHGLLFRCGATWQLVHVACSSTRLRAHTTT
jgi:hypothetical protein